MDDFIAYAPQSYYIDKYPYLSQSIQEDWFEHILSPVFHVAERIHRPVCSGGGGPAEPSKAQRITKAYNAGFGCGDNGAFEKKRKSYNLLKQLNDNLKERASEMYPPLNGIWFFTQITPLDEINVIICGRDPYIPPPAVTDGMAFSCDGGGGCGTISGGVSPSLQNIFKSIAIQFDRPDMETRSNGSLVKWAEQGVLLMNTLFTVGHQPNSHTNLGWEELSSMILYAIALRSQIILKKPLFVITWGQYIRRKLVDEHVLIHRPDMERLRSSLLKHWRVSKKEENNLSKDTVIDDTYHKIIYSVDPLSRNGNGKLLFLDNKNFVECDKFLSQTQRKKIDWFVDDETTSRQFFSGRRSLP